MMEISGFKKKQKEISLTFVVIGDCKIGKTSFVRRYVTNNFRPKTIALEDIPLVDFVQKRVQWTDDTTILVQILDVAGDEKLFDVKKLSYEKADGCLLMFDLCDIKTFQKALWWKQELDEKSDRPRGSSPHCLLLGNKSDKAQRVITADMLQGACMEHKCVGWRACSAKENIGVDHAVKFLIEETLSKSVKEENHVKGSTAVSFHRRPLTVKRMAMPI